MVLKLPEYCTVIEMSVVHNLAMLHSFGNLEYVCLLVVL